MNNKTRAKL